MTADVDLLPLPEWQGGFMTESEFREEAQAYARDNVLHHIAAKDAEIAHERWLREQAENMCVAVQDQREALREEVENVTCELMDALTRAGKLAEALEDIRSRSSINLAMHPDPFELTAKLGDIYQIADAALAKENSND